MYKSFIILLYYEAFHRNKGLKYFSYKHVISKTLEYKLFVTENAKLGIYAQITHL